MSIAENKDLIARYVATLSGKPKPAAIVAEFTDSAELHAHVATFEAAFPHYELLVDEVIAEGDKVVAVARFRGTHAGGLMGIAPTGKSVTVPFIIVYTIAGGQVGDRKIAGFNLAIDQMDLLKQLGVMN